VNPSTKKHIAGLSAAEDASHLRQPYPLSIKDASRVLQMQRIRTGHGIPVFSGTVSGPHQTRGGGRLVSINAFSCRR